MPDPIDAQTAEFVRQAACSDKYASYLRDLLTELIDVNTAGEGSIADIASRENRLFDIISRELSSCGVEIHIERVPVDPAIGDDPHYTVPLYAMQATGEFLPADRIYENRCNLVASIGGSAVEKGIRPVILHAHVDVVPPWFPARREGDRIFGRGACDNKSQVAILLAQIRLLRDLQAEVGSSAKRSHIYQFVIDEEIGGNGSLALARDPRWANASVIVHETTGLRPYCAHRGCVYYRCRLSTAGAANLSALEMFPLAVIAMENEGRRIREESNAPMFLPTHVQTNHGMLGGFGRACGAVCDHVAIEVTSAAQANAERIRMNLIEFLDEGIAEYVKLYGDKSRELDPATGKPKVARHFDVRVTPGPEFHRIRLDFFGKGGHMGALAECDNAITKAAYLLGFLLQILQRIPQVRTFSRLLDQPGMQTPADPTQTTTELWLQGGQGFTPAHRMEDIKSRLAAAVQRGVQRYCQTRRVPFDPSMVQMHFDLLHNDAYADSPDCEPMVALREAFSALGKPWPEPVAWETSCDARLYHHRGCPVAIFGAGPLEAAHGPDEYVDIPEMQEALAASTLATWSMIK